MPTVPPRRAFPAPLDLMTLPMMTDSQQHIATLDQLEALQDQVLVDLEELEQRVDRLLREALRLSNAEKKGGAAPAAGPQLAEQTAADSPPAPATSTKGRSRKSRAA